MGSQTARNVASTDGVFAEAGHPFASEQIIESAPMVTKIIQVVKVCRLMMLSLQYIPLLTS